MSKHTPNMELPWRREERRIEYGPLVAGDGFCIAELRRDPGDWEAKGDFLCLAVNSHDELVHMVGELSAVLGELALECEGRHTMYQAVDSVLTEARAALAKAGVEV